MWRGCGRDAERQRPLEAEAELGGVLELVARRQLERVRLQQALEHACERRGEERARGTGTAAEAVGKVAAGGAFGAVETKARGIGVQRWIPMQEPGAHHYCRPFLDEHVSNLYIDAGAAHEGVERRMKAQRLLDGRARLTAVADPDPKRLEPFAAVQRFADAGALIRSGLVDAVLIATPHYDHVTVGIDALANGLHVLVEKPLAVHKADCERLLAAYAARIDPRQQFGVMFNLRTLNRFAKSARARSI